MTVMFNPGGRLNIAADSADLPEEGDDKGRISSDAMTRCKNMRMDRDGQVTLRRGSDKLNETAIGLTNYITEQNGVRYVFSDDLIFRNEQLISVLNDVAVKFYMTNLSGTGLQNAKVISSDTISLRWFDGEEDTDADDTSMSKSFTETGTGLINYFFPADPITVTKFRLDGNNLSGIENLDIMPNLATLEIVGQAQTGGNGLLKGFSYTGSQLTSISLSAMKAISNYDFSNFTNIIVLNTQYCLSLSTVTLPASISTTSGNTLTFTWCNFDSSAVDGILQAVDGWANNNGTINISNNTAPGAAGLTAKGNLEGRGWTVTVDS